MGLGLEQNSLLVVTKAGCEGGLMTDSGGKSLYGVRGAQIDDSTDNCNVLGHKVRVCLDIRSVTLWEALQQNTYHLRHLDRYSANTLRDFIRF